MLEAAPSRVRKGTFQIAEGPKVKTDVQGYVTEYFGIAKLQPEKHNKEKPWGLTHRPTGYLVGKFYRLGTAKLVAVEIEDHADAGISSADPDTAARVLRPFAAYAHNNQDISFDEFKSVASDRDAGEIARAEEANRWEGKLVYWIDGSNYGRTAKLVGVDVPKQPPGWLKVGAVEWKNAGGASGSTTLGMRVRIDEIKVGPGLMNMPWYRFSSTWIAKIDGWRYHVGSVGDNYLVWNEYPPGPHKISQFSSEIRFDSLKRAQKFAEKHGTGVDVEAATRYAMGF